MSQNKAWSIFFMSAMVFASSAYGQDATAEPIKAAASQSRLIEEILVTAQKREELMQDVPISVAAFSSDALDARGIQDASDLEMITPSLIYDQLVSYSVIYMRGVGTDVFLPNQEPSVATYIDGVYFPFSHGLAQDFLPLERVEVLKGPQGTLYGRNATAGAINVITVQPSQEWQGSLDAGIGNYDARRYKAHLSGPLTDSLSFSLAAMQADEETYYSLHESSPLSELADNHSQGSNIRLRWEPWDQLSVNLSYYDADFDGTWSVVTSQTRVTPLGTVTGGRNTGPRETAFSDPGTVDSQTEVWSAQIEYRPEFMDVKLILSDMDMLTNMLWDYDNGPLNAVSFYPTKQYSEVQSAELQFVSSDTSPGADYLQWIAGFYYFENEAGFDPNYVSVLNLGNPGLPSTIVSPVLGLLNDLGVPTPSNLVAVNLRGVLETESLAAFVQATWSPIDWLGITLGMRYQKEDRLLVKSTTGYTTASPQQSAGNDSVDIVLLDYAPEGNKPSVENSDLSPRLAVDFKLWDDALIYASWTQGFKSGTLNIQNVYSPPSALEPEKVTAYELGAKGTALNGSLRYSAALFRNTIEDLQTQVVSFASGGLIVLVNAAEAEIEGFEMDLLWEAFPNAVPGLVFTAAGAYLHGRYTHFPEGPGFDESTGLAFGAQAQFPARDFSGHETVRTPEYSGTLGLSYTFDVPGGELELGSEVYYNSGYYFDTQNVTSQPEYYLVNARASYFISDWNVRVSAFGKNLNDDLYYLNIFANDFGHAATGGPPATYGLSVNWEFL